MQGLDRVPLLRDREREFRAQLESRTTAVFAARHSRLRKGSGKKVWRLQPDLEWDKGRAVRLRLERLGLDRPQIVVRGEDHARETAALYALAGCDDVRRCLELLIGMEPECP